MAPHRPPPHAASPVAASDGLCASNGACFQACACPCQASVLFRSAAGHWPPVACSGPDTLTVVFKVDDVGGPHGLGVRSLHSVLTKTRVSPPLSPAPSERPATFPSPLETGPQRAETTRQDPRPESDQLPRQARCIRRGPAPLPIAARARTASFLKSEAYSLPKGTTGNTSVCRSPCVGE